jgi:small basic protein (TIGR04137 family)
MIHKGPTTAAGRVGTTLREGWLSMSMDRSLKTSTTMTGKRSVLTRAERVAKMISDKKFDPKKDKVLGIPKTLVGKA